MIRERTRIKSWFPAPWRSCSFYSILWTLTLRDTEICKGCYFPRQRGRGGRILKTFLCIFLLLFCNCKRNNSWGRWRVRWCVGVARRERKSVISALGLYSIQKSTIDKREASLLAERGWQSRLSRATGKVNRLCTGAWKTLIHCAKWGKKGNGLSGSGFIQQTSLSISPAALAPVATKAYGRKACPHSYQNQGQTYGKKVKRWCFL